jgi:Lon protease-like protein
VIQAGNVTYRGPADMPATVPLLPLAPALLLPRAKLPLNIFETRYLGMVEAAMRGDRLIGVIQPRFDDGEIDLEGEPPLTATGGLGRIVQYGESGDGRLFVVLAGICRFRLVEELARTTAWRQGRVDTEFFARDFIPGLDADKVDRGEVLATLKAYLDANDLQADMEGVDEAPIDGLVNSLCMMAPYGPAEKQAFLEAESLPQRAELLIAVTEYILASQGKSEPRGPLQ